MKKNKVVFNESLVSMILGAVVVFLIALLAYNYFRNNKPAATTTTTAPVEQTENSNGEVTKPTLAVALPTQHKVAAGENLWDISQKYYSSGYNFVDVIAANKLTNPNILLVGQVLTIPNVSVRMPLTGGSITPPTVTLPPIVDETYTVRSGDNLWDIAVRAYGNGYRFEEIAKLNNIVNARIIHAGNILRIPRP